MQYYVCEFAVSLFFLLFKGDIFGMNMNFTNCNSDITFSDCSVQDTFTRSRKIYNVVHGHYNPGNCSWKNVSYDWQITNDDRVIRDYKYYHHNETFLIPPNTLDTKMSTIAVYVRECSKTKCYMNLYEGCVMYIHLEEIVIEFKGGYMVEVSPNVAFQVSASNSFDRNFLDEKIPKKLFRWSCTSNKKVGKKFCKHLPQGTSQFEIPSHVMEDGLNIDITLKIKNALHVIGQASQKISVKTGQVYTNIMCDFNCPEVNVNGSFQISLECPLDCPTSTIKWEAKLGSQKHTREGTRTFELSPENFKDITDTILDIKAESSVSCTRRKFRLKRPFEFLDCVVEPSSGIIRKTEFGVSCTTNQDYGVYGISLSMWSKDIPVAMAPVLKQLKFVAPKYLSSIKVWRYDPQLKERTETIVPMANLTRYTLPIIDEVKSVSQGMAKLLQLKEAQAENPDEPINEHLKKLLDDLLKLENEWEGITHIIVNSYELFYKENPDPEMEKFMFHRCQLCLKYASKDMQNIGIFGKRALNNMGLLSECGNIGIVQRPIDLKENVPDLPDYNEKVISTEVQEYYEAYDDFFEVLFKNLLKEFQSLGDQFVQFATDQMSAMGSAPDGKNNPSQSKSTLVGILHNNSKINHERVNVEFPINPSIDFWYCITKNNPYWLLDLESGLVIASDVMIYHFYDTRRKEFTKEIPQTNVTFKLPILSSDIKFLTHEGQFTSTSKDFEILRIDAHKEREYFIQVSMTSKLKILVTKGRKSENPFEEEEIREMQEGVLFIKNITKDTWHYLYIIHDDIVSVNYSISVFMQECYTWDNEEKKWQLTGQVLDTFEREVEVKCLIKHASALAVGLINNFVFREPLHLFLENFSIAERPCFLIIYLSLLMFLIYCIVMVNYSFQCKRKRIIMLVGDTPSNFQYGYVIVVKTGNKFNAGTTSNVKIRLIGEKHCSLAHVLNYPDPDKQLLQRNQEDWFAIGSKYYLGNISAIELWFDSVGHRPSWYCKSIEVMELLDQQYWYFPIDRWFDLLRSQQLMRVYPQKLEEIQETGCHFFTSTKNPEEKMKKDLKLTLMFSGILSSCAFSVIFLFLVKAIRDTFAILLTITFSSVLTIAIHKPLIYWFKLRHRSNFKPWSILTFVIVVNLNILIIGGYHTTIDHWMSWTLCSTITIIMYNILSENVLMSLKSKIHHTRDYGRKRMFIIRKRLKYFHIFLFKQKLSIYEKFGKLGLRPFLKDHYFPLPEEEMMKRKVIQENRKGQFYIFEDIMMFGVYVILLYIVLLSNKDSLAVHNNREVKELMSGVQSRTMSPGDIVIINNTYHYIFNTLIYVMHSRKWYGHYVSINSGMMIDKANKFLGIARIRQHRSVKPCPVHKVMRNLNLICFPEYSQSEGGGSFGEYWTENVTEHRLAEIWRYKISQETGSENLKGYITTYPGSGYVATLGRNMLNSYINFEYLLNRTWIDLQTRFIIIEFLTYNAFANMFNAVRIIIENSASGLILSNVQIFSVRLLLTQDDLSAMVIAIIISFIVWLSILFIKNVSTLTKSPKRYLSDYWYIIDLIIIGMSCSYIVIFALRMHALKKFLLKIGYARHNEFIKYFHLLRTEMNLHILAAVLICVSTLRLWKLMRFFKFFRLMERTLILSIPHFISIAIAHNIIIVAYSCSGMLLFGSQSFHFSTLNRAFVSLNLMALGFGRRFSDDIIQNGLHQFYYATFVGFSFVMINIYICITIISYTEALQLPDVEYSTMDYVKDQLKYLRVKMRFERDKRLKGGQDSIGYVIPRPAILQGGMPFSTTKDRLSAMKWVAKCVIRNRDSEEESDMELMKNTVYYMFKKDSNEPVVAYLWNKTAIVTEERLQKMIFIINNVLAEDSFQKREQIRRKYLEARKLVQSLEEKIDRIHRALICFKDCIKGIKIEE